MSYALTANSVARVKAFLDEMLTAKGDVSWDTNDPMLAYRIRQGIAAAAHLKLEAYGGLSTKYIVRQARDKVIAELRNKLEIERLRDSLLASSTKITVRDAISLLEIIGAVVKHGADELYFPLAVLDETELVRLEKFAGTKGYEVLNHEEEGVTMRRKQ